MPEAQIKPLNWSPPVDEGYTVVRRPDGGMHYTFQHLSPATLTHWRAFALEHLLDSDRLQRNLYDLRQVRDLPPEAVPIAVEVASDPSARNLRVAVVVASSHVRAAISEIDALSLPPGGVEMGIFDNLESAEAWLARPLSLLT
jgi:hypothetical protein